MSVMPDTRLAKIEFCEQHLSTFSANAVAIGTSAAAVADLTTKTEAARAARQAAFEARNAAKALTLDYHEKVAVMSAAVANIISQIKTQAGITGPSVYTLAQIPAPATPTPVGPLAKPDNFAVALLENGALKLTWKCAQPKSASGVTYQIWRRIGTTGAFVSLGGTGAKEFTDSTVPAGSASVTYQLQATRSTSIGPWAQFTVNFGVDTGGAITATVTEGSPVNLAA